MATHSSIPAWEIPWPVEPGGLQSMGSQENQRQLSTKPPFLTLTKFGQVAVAEFESGSVFQKHI